MTPSDATHLLRRLEPVVRPGSVGDRFAVNRQPLESRSFDALLAQASAGGLDSGRGVDASCTFDPPLDGSQLARLAAAGDLAQAAGARSSLMIVDGRLFLMDVGQRLLTQELTSEAGPRLVDVDAAVHTGAAGASPRSGTLPPPPASMPPAGAMRQLADASGHSPPPPRLSD